MHALECWNCLSFGISPKNIEKKTQTTQTMYCLQRYWKDLKQPKPENVCSRVLTRYSTHVVLEVNLDFHLCWVILDDKANDVQWWKVSWESWEWNWHLDSGDIKASLTWGHFKGFKVGEFHLSLFVLMHLNYVTYDVLMIKLWRAFEFPRFFLLESSWTGLMMMTLFDGDCDDWILKWL